MSRDLLLYIEDMRVCCDRVMRFTRGMDFEGFLNDEKTLDAVLRNLEILGEAAKNVPTEFREKHASLDWRAIAGLRDVLAHSYFGLEDETIWDIVQNKVPDTLEKLQAILSLPENT